jgi:SAM-dependent methyltransferase
VRVNPVAQYWDHGVDSVPQMTGAAHLMDANDMIGLAMDLRFELPLANVLDVGCGTGRIAKHCTNYYGVDISSDAVAYCRRAGLTARLIDGPRSLAREAWPTFDMVTCMSVFTHIDENERALYLARFKRLAPRLLVDIIPGDGSGDVPLWTADTDQFESSLLLTGYQVYGVTDRKAQADDYLHRYYYAKVNA